MIVVVALAIDGSIRTFAIVTSSYYRLVEIPEWALGFIGASIGVIGLFVPSIARKTNASFGTLANLGIAATMAGVGMLTIAPAWKYVGVLPGMLLMTTLGFLSFTVSRALHREADSSKRATVLSVKGLAFNLGYGIYGLMFSRLLIASAGETEETALRGALMWQAPIFLLMMIALFIWAGLHWRRYGST